MADTGAPWNIPYAEPSNLVRDWPALSEDVAEAVAAGLSATGLNASTTITATDATWSVPTLGNPVVRVTVIGGGGGGGGTTANDNGATGGTTVFGQGAGFEISSQGGAGGNAFPNTGANTNGSNGNAGFASGNGGTGRASRPAAGEYTTSGTGSGGAIKVGYVDLTGVSTVNVVIGAGGAGGSSAGSGGRGEVIVEYLAG
jgi:hypothetical protein